MVIGSPFCLCIVESRVLSFWVRGLPKFRPDCIPCSEGRVLVFSYNWNYVRCRFLVLGPTLLLGLSEVLLFVTDRPIYETSQYLRTVSKKDLSLTFRDKSRLCDDPPNFDLRLLSKESFERSLDFSSRVTFTVFLADWKVDIVFSSCIRCNNFLPDCGQPSGFLDARLS